MCIYIHDLVILIMVFSHILPQHSLEILVFATRHRYDGLISSAAPLLLQTRLLDVLEVLPADWTLPWVRHHLKDIPTDRNVDRSLVRSVTPPAGTTY